MSHGGIKSKSQLSVKRFYSSAYHMSAGDLFIRLMKDDPSTVKGAETLILGEMLTLPQNFG